MQMQTYTGRELRGLTLALDGKRFIGCQLIQCRLIFKGAHLPEFKDTRIVDCQILLQGAASTTMKMLASLYQSGQGSMVESIFAHLKGEVAAVDLPNPQR